jgi:ABC-2 type transport system ATP-binding protein
VLTAYKGYDPFERMHQHDETPVLSGNGGE